MNFKTMRERKSFIALVDGAVFHGWSFGSPRDCAGEAVFNTGMSGYQEIVTDPSYYGQIVVLTVPEVGNYGCNSADAESRALFFNGLVVHGVNEPSNFRSSCRLADYLRESGKPAIAGVDTRSLTLHLRKHGSQKAWLHVSDEDMSESEAVALASEWAGLDCIDSASEVTTKESYNVGCSSGDDSVFHVVVLDFGVKKSILNNMAQCGMRLTVLPASAKTSDVMALCPDGLFLSNGPGDPVAVHGAAENIRGILGRIPVMGICLGHQLLSIACGGKTARLKFGHHGCNHPVRNIETGHVEITSQNHNFALTNDSVPDCLEVTHVNLNDGTIEGVRHKELPAFSVQYHPEAGPGPHDSLYLFRQFAKMMEKAKK